MSCLVFGLYFFAPILFFGTKCNLIRVSDVYAGVWTAQRFENWYGFFVSNIYIFGIKFAICDFRNAPLLDGAKIEIRHLVLVGNVLTSKFRIIQFVGFLKFLGHFYSF